MFTSIDEVMRRPIEFTALPLISVIVAGLIHDCRQLALGAGLLPRGPAAACGQASTCSSGSLSAPILGRLSLRHSLYTERCSCCRHDSCP